MQSQITDQRFSDVFRRTERDQWHEMGLFQKLSELLWHVCHLKQVSSFWSVTNKKINLDFQFIMNNLHTKNGFQSHEYSSLDWDNKTCCVQICDTLRDLAPFVQFEKREKHPWRSVTFSKVAGSKPAIF